MCDSLDRYMKLEDPTQNRNRIRNNANTGFAPIPKSHIIRRQMSGVYYHAISHAPPKPKVLPPHPDTAPPKPTLRCTNHPLPDIYPPLSSAHTSYVLTCAIRPSHRHGLDLRDSRVRAVVAPPPVHLATAVAIAATAATPCTMRRATATHSGTSPCNTSTCTRGYNNDGSR